MTGLRLLFVIVFLAWLAPAHAADVVYPLGSRLGLVPPAGMTSPPGAQGFEDRANKAAILVVALPEKAYAEVDKMIGSEDDMKKQGVTIDRRETLTTPLGEGKLAIGQQQQFGIEIRKWILAVQGKKLTALVTVQMPEAARKAYPDEVIHSALATLTARVSVPDDEQMSLLPFGLRDRAGFHIATVLPGRGVMLSDAEQDVPDFAVAPHMFIGASPGAPSLGEDRGLYAQRLFNAITNLKEVRIVSAEPLRISGTLGYQIMANAKDAVTNADLMLVQWLRFGNESHIEMIATAKAADWAQAFPRFRTVRDGFDLH